MYLLILKIFLLNYTQVQRQIYCPCLFIKENIVAIWKISDEPPVNTELNTISFPQAYSVCCKNFSGCVTDLQIAPDCKAVISSSLGYVSVFHYSTMAIMKIHTWPNLHTFRANVPAPVTGIAVKGEQMATVGEDGHANVICLQSSRKLKEIDFADLCSLSAVSFVKAQEVVVGNSLGRLKVWDLRTSTASSLLGLSRFPTVVSSLKVHPIDSYILAAGYGDGCLCLWDLRQHQKPRSQIQGHSAEIAEMVFDPANDFLFTVSMDGSLLKYDASNLKKDVPKLGTAAACNPEITSVKSPWLNYEENRDQLIISSLYSQPDTCINSIDLSGSKLLWSTDTEALCILDTSA